jgi:hypothetical protein
VLPFRLAGGPETFQHWLHAAGRVAQSHNLTAEKKKRQNPPS